jgi:DNA invertase Pin-like site-specific DNA recombinase
MDRPALRQLLEDIRAKRVDIVVVYKVDRLTRSLTDFAKIVEVFDAHHVSFVSVTQAFNTTSSMGRLTLNVLLSFAQFEREVTGERIRDKIAASKKKGLWMGGFAPFGYRPHERTLVIDEPKAEIVRLIFQIYLQLGSVPKVVDELDRRQLRTPTFNSATGKAWGGRPFNRGQVARILENPVYVGEIAHKEQTYQGQHEAIIDRSTWDAVQETLTANTRKSHVTAYGDDPSLLAGLLVDAEGRHFTCSHALKNGRRYRYYLSPKAASGAKQHRLPAHAVESAVAEGLRRFFTDPQAVAGALEPLGVDADALESALRSAKDLAAAENLIAQREMLLKLVDRIQVAASELVVQFKLAALVPSMGPDALHEIEVPMETRLSAGRATIVASSREVESDPTLVKNIARGFCWFEELASGRTETVKIIAKREGVTDRFVSRLIELALLSPKIVDAALKGGRLVRLSSQALTKETELDTLWRV